MTSRDEKLRSELGSREVLLPLLRSKTRGALLVRIILLFRKIRELVRLREKSKFESADDRRTLDALASSPKLALLTGVTTALIVTALIARVLVLKELGPC